MNLAVIFKAKSYPDSIFTDLIRSNPACYLLIMQVSQLSANSADSQCKANLWNRQKYLNLEHFSFFILLLDYAKQVFWMFNFEVPCKEIQPIFISSCITLSMLFLSEDLFWFNFFADFTDAKLVSTHKNGKTSFYMSIIKSFFNFPPTPQICSAEQIYKISGNF